MALGGSSITVWQVACCCSRAGSLLSAKFTAHRCETQTGLLHAMCHVLRVKPISVSQPLIVVLKAISRGFRSFTNTLTAPRRRSVQLI
jgi:hypothetical protein